MSTMKLLQDWCHRRSDLPDIWTTDHLLMFLAFFVPGFIAMQIYSMIIPTGDRDFTKSLPEAVAYSAIHYAVFGWPLLFLKGMPFTIVAYVVVLLIPVFEAPAVLLLRNFDYYKKRFFTRYVLDNLLRPEAEPWDCLFDGEQRWIRITLKNGGFVGGVLGIGSLISTYPSPHEIYVREQWSFKPDGGFNAPVNRSGGFIVSGDQITLVELFT